MSQEPLVKPTVPSHWSISGDNILMFLGLKQDGRKTSIHTYSKQVYSEHVQEEKNVHNHWKYWKAPLQRLLEFKLIQAQEKFRSDKVTKLFEGHFPVDAVSLCICGIAVSLLLQSSNLMIRQAPAGSVSETGQWLSQKVFLGRFVFFSSCLFAGIKALNVGGGICLQFPVSWEVRCCAGSWWGSSYRAPCWNLFVGAADWETKSFAAGLLVASLTFSEFQ